MQHPTLCAVPLYRGAAAPFDGQLLSLDLALALGQAANGCDDRLKLAVDRQHDDDAVELTKQETVYNAQIAAFQADLAKANAAADRARAVAEAEKPPWFAQPWFVAPVAAIAAAAVVTFVHR